jgi:hypothetical protein
VVVRQAERGDADAAATVVAAAEAFAQKPERLVQPNRGLVPGKDVKFELAHAGPSGPDDGPLEQQPADAAPAAARRDDQPEVRHVSTGGMRVAGDGQPPDDLVAVEGDEHRGVRVPPDGPQVPALLDDAPHSVGRQQPPTGLCRDRRRERDELAGVARLGRSDADHRTTEP